jgi:hypothetical protein
MDGRGTAAAKQSIPGSASNPIEIVDVEPVEIVDVEPIQIIDVEPIQILDVEPIQILDVEPIQIVDVEPIQIVDVEPAEIVDVEQAVVQSPSLPILPTVVNAFEINDEETAATAESTPVVVEMQDEGYTFLEEVIVDDVSDNGYDDFSESSDVPTPMEVAALQDEEIIFTLEANFEETVATVESAPLPVEAEDEGSTFSKESDVDDIHDYGCDHFIRSSALNPIEIVVQSPLPVLPAVVDALEASVDETAVAVEPAPVVVETEDESSTFVDEVDVGDMNDAGCEDLSESSGVPEPVEPPVEPLALQNETIEDNSPLAMVIEPPNEKTLEEAVVNEGLIPSDMDKVGDGEESTTILPQPIIESNTTLEETTEGTIQDIRQKTTEDTTAMGSAEGDPEDNHEEPTSTITPSFLSYPIKSDESSGEDIDTTFEVTDNEEDVEDSMEETPEKSDEDVVTCKAENENDNFTISSFARSSSDQKNGYASHTSNESPEPGGYVSSSVEVHSQGGADEEIPMDPNLIEQGRASGVVTETKVLIPKETLWGKHKVKCALGCFLLLVLLAVLLGVVVGGSGGGASPSKSPNEIAPSPSPSVASTAFDLEKFQALLPAYSQAALLDETSSQAKAFTWLERDSDLNFFSDFQRLQRFALATLFYATNGEQWSNNEGWVENFPFDECDWFLGEPLSIEECVNGRHEELNLDLNGLVGTLPDELAMMTDLKILRMSFNGLKGAIPSEYGLLTNLNTLSLYLNILDGRIPSELGRLTALEDIDLTRNSLTGPIPSEVLAGWNKVKVLRISGNNFSGAIPSEVGDLKKAEYIDFSDNGFEGQIPTELALLTNLETLYLHNNANISGQIPSVLGNLSQLQIITFDNTNLSGAMPRELCGLMQRHFIVIEVDCSRITCDCGCTCV